MAALAGLFAVLALTLDRTEDRPITDHCGWPEASVIRTDLDGDRRPDRVFFGWRDDSAKLRTCTASGVVDEIEVGGMGEGSFEVFDLQPDGRPEIEDSGKTGSGFSAGILVFLDGRLRPVTGPDGRELGFEYIWLTGDERNEGWQERRRWGCGDTNGGGRRELVQVSVRTDATGSRYRRDFYEVRGATASLVHRDEGPSTILADSSDQRRDLASPC